MKLSIKIVKNNRLKAYFMVVLIQRNLKGVFYEKR